jgi:protein SCO1/2
MSRLERTLVSLAVGAIVALGGAASAAPVDPSQIQTRMEPAPKRLQGVDVVERLEGRLEEKLSFVADDGRAVLLGDFFRGDVPVIVTLNYSDCPMLCSLQLNALVDGLKQVDLTLGKDYRIVTVSLNPQETPERAHDMKRRYLAQYGRPEVTPGAWTILTGSENNIRAVADGIGFSYGYNEKRDEYVHPAAFVVTTPDGMIARYLYGLEYHPKTLRLSLIEASEGKVGSAVDKLILYCFHYDASEGRYAPVAMNIMRVGGGSGAVALGGFLTVLWRAERRKKHGT